MSFIDDDECNKIEKMNSIHKCEICVLKKMHKIFNHQFVKTLKKIIKKNQKFHIDLIEDDNIVKTFKNNRYAIIFVDDYTDFT